MIVVIVPPGRRIEKVAPIFDLLMPAFDSMAASRKVLVWLAGEDHEELSARTAGRDDVIVKSDDAPFDRMMAACDLAVTKGNRNTVLELAALGVPSVSISHGLNSIDDIRTARIGTNRTLYADGLDSATLADHMGSMLASKPDRQGIVSDGAAKAAETLVAFLERHHAGS